MRAKGHKAPIFHLTYITHTFILVCTNMGGINVRTGAAVTG